MVIMSDIDNFRSKYLQYGISVERTAVVAFKIRRNYFLVLYNAQYLDCCFPPFLAVTF